MKDEKSEYGKKYSGHKKKSRRPNCSSGIPSHMGHNSPKEWMNCLTNLTYTCNPSTTPRYLQILGNFIIYKVYLALVVWGIRIQPTFALVRVVKGD